MNATLQLPVVIPTRHGPVHPALRPVRSRQPWARRRRLAPPLHAPVVAATVP